MRLITWIALFGTDGPNAARRGRGASVQNGSATITLRLSAWKSTWNTSPAVFNPWSMRDVGIGRTDLLIRQANSEHGAVDNANVVV